jgi:hypothetical protein
LSNRRVSRPSLSLEIIFISPALRQAVFISMLSSQIRATSQQDISRARLWFFEGKKKILLYSERSHFYHRYKVTSSGALLVITLCSSCCFCVWCIVYVVVHGYFLDVQIRGTKHLLVYSLPGRKEFYPEVLTKKNCDFFTASSHGLKLTLLGFVSSFSACKYAGRIRKPQVQRPLLSSRPSQGEFAVSLSLVKQTLVVSRPATNSMFSCSVCSVKKSILISV